MHGERGTEVISRGVPIEGIGSQGGGGVTGIRTFREGVLRSNWKEVGK